jgi:nucleoid-associated protein YgaU
MKDEKDLSMLLGIMVLVLGGWVVMSSIGKFFPKPQVSDKAANTTLDTVLEQKQKTEKDGVYVVEPGDSLWAIASKAYGDGYKWTEVWRANMASVGDDPGKLEVGMQLNLPAKSQAVKEYTTQTGDYLWKIALDLCGDGYLWTKIAQDNSVAHPNLIFAGRKFKIDCSR